MTFKQGHALLIGVGSHQNAPELNVPVTVADAKAVAEVLTNPGLGGYIPDQVQLLHDAAASSQGILGALDQLGKRTNANDTVLIFYCGHGDYGADGEYYLVSHDARLKGGKVASGSGVSQTALLTRLKTIPAQRVLMIFNACHSGEISPTLSVDQATGAKVLPNAAADALLSTGSGRIIITACREEQFSYIGSGQITLFTQALVDGLRGKGVLTRGGFISAFDLYTMIYETVSAKVRQLYNREQEPELTVLKGVGPFAVSLYKGAQETNLGLAEAPEVPTQVNAVRQVAPETSERLFQQIVNQSGGVSIGQADVSGNVIGDVHGDVIDARGAQGTIIRPTGAVEQVFGNKIDRGTSLSGRGSAGRGPNDIAVPTHPLPTLDQFTNLLAKLHAGLGATGLAEKIQKSIVSDVTTVEVEAKDSQPSLPVIEAKLTSIQVLLQNTADVGPAALSLIEIVQKSLALARQLFK